MNHCYMLVQTISTVNQLQIKHIKKQMQNDESRNAHSAKFQNENVEIFISHTILQSGNTCIGNILDRLQHYTVV